MTSKDRRRVFRARCLFSVSVFLLAARFVSMSQSSTPDAQLRLLFAEAESAYQHGDSEGAIHLYERLLQLQPRSIPARANLAVALAHVGRYDDAVVQYRLALKDAPGNPSLLLNLALARYKQAKFEQAALDLQKVRSKQPENRQALYLLADCYLRLGRNQEVIALLQPVDDAGPEDRSVEFALGMAFLREGEIQKAEAIIDRVFKTGNSGEVELLLGAAQLAAGDAKTAVPTLQKAMQMNPDLPGGWSLYGKALIDIGDSEAAKNALEKALNADPNDFDANLFLGGILRHDGDPGGSAPYLRRALQLRPASIEARFQVGMLEMGEGHLDDARRKFEQIERESPEFQEVHAQLAVVYARLNLPKDSKRERDIVLQLNEKARARKKADEKKE